MDFFSIIIPVFGTEKFLKRCINSILIQDFDDYEIICVNDCSPGNCKEIIQEINSEKIIYLENQQNSGTHVARMNGVKRANSQYTLFLDSDDYYVKGALKNLYEVLKDLSIDQLEFGYDSIPYHNKTTFQYDVNKDSILEKVIRGEKDYVNYSLCNKVTKTQKIKEAFSRMKEFYCIWFEDGYEQFYISSICKKFDSLKKDFLILDETSGITTTNKELSAEKYLLRCENVYSALTGLEDYIKHYGLEKYKPIIDNSFQVHPCYLMNTFLPTVKRSDMSLAIKGMFQYFPDDVINNCLYDLLHRSSFPVKKNFKHRIKNMVKKIFF